MSRDLLIALAAGLLSAVLYLSVKTGSPSAFVFAYMSQLPLFAAGLSRGTRAGLIACGSATLVLFIGINPLAAGLFLLLTAGPVALIVRQALLTRPGRTPDQEEFYPIGLLLGWLAIYGIVLLTGSVFYFAGTPGGIIGFSQNYLEAVLGSLAGGADPRLPAMAGAMAHYFPSAVIATWTLMVLVNATLAQRVLVQFGLSRRPAPVFSELELPQWLAIGILAAALGSLMSGSTGTVAVNALVVLALPFLFQGLAVIHVLARRLSARGIFLIAVYLILVLFGWPAVLVALLGVIEQWVHLRRRYGPPGGNEENE